jgi:hypothetical protein
MAARRKAVVRKAGSWRWSTARGVEYFLIEEILIHYFCGKEFCFESTIPVIAAAPTHNPVIKIDVKTTDPMPIIQSLE